MVTKARKGYTKRYQRFDCDLPHPDYRGLWMECWTNYPVKAARVIQQAAALDDGTGAVEGMSSPKGRLERFLEALVS